MCAHNEDLNTCICVYIYLYYIRIHIHIYSSSIPSRLFVMYAFVSNLEMYTFASESTKHVFIYTLSDTHTHPHKYTCMYIEIDTR